MKRYQVFDTEECSDGEYRKYGNPIFEGEKKDAMAFVEEYSTPFPNGFLVVHEVTYKKGNAVKRREVNLKEI